MRDALRRWGDLDVPYDRAASSGGPAPVQALLADDPGRARIWMTGHADAENTFDGWHWIRGTKRG